MKEENKEESSWWFCLICKDLAKEDKARGVIGRGYLCSKVRFSSEEEAIKHIRRMHFEEYKQCIEKEKEE